MIKQVSLRNFQSHIDTTLDLSKSVNVIVGESDQGKTSILRAINWVAKNVPRGNPFFSNYADSDEISASIVMEEGAVNRSRDDDSNEYVLIPADDPINAEKFIAKTGVPEEVSKLLNLHPQINIQNQMDAPFLLMQSAGDAGRLVNQLVRLETIDKTLSAARSTKREEERDRKRLSGEVAQDEGIAEGLRRTVDQVAHVHHLEEDVDRLDEIWLDIEDLDSRINEYGEIEKRTSRYDAVIEVRDSAEEVASLLESHKEISAIVQDLLYNIERHEEAEVAAKEAEVAASVDTDGIEQQVKALEESRALIDALAEALDADYKAHHSARRYEKLHAEFEEMMPEVCPFCERPF